ncbi:phosphorylase family protein [Puniceicoccus vermicola]|uniref:Phosphorylase n=1 Tax=Puniceicoccus vermicola TaxID=388746 RepID=A0A7X1B0X3_9BACT|nr:phosphorylase [Puniceicoccus vermicola]MBC2603593.1 phosphorylase [Puniceicoccus vermicola]
MIAFITGSGFYELEGFAPEEHDTRFGTVRLLRGDVQGNPVLILPRHGSGHRNLPHQITHRANLTALKEAGATAIVSCTVCGVTNGTWELGSPIVANDLWFPDNRLGDGSACTVFTEPGESGRGHLLAGSFFHTALSQSIRDYFECQGGKCFSGCYAHGNGPRFNSRAEIRGIQAAGADFISQTCGPEAIMANELEIPFALAGFGVDFANGVKEKPTPIQVLQVNMGRAKTAFVGLIYAIASSGEKYKFENFVYRFD